MAVGSGICSQFGFKNETTVGTPVTVDHFYKHVTIGGDGLDTIVVTDEGLGGCVLVPTVDRTVTTGQTVTRDVELNVGTRGLGLLFKQAINSTLAAPVLISGSFYRQIHTPAETAGRSLTVQFGFPEAVAAGTIRAFTINGAKITEWELSQARNELLKFRFTLDGWAETTATGLAAATYSTGTGATINEALRFNCFSAKLGGTASIATGLVSVAGGTEIAGCRGVSVKGVTPLRTDGFFSGGAGTKTEQFVNGFFNFTAELDLEFQSRTQVYDVYAAYTTTPLELSWVGKVDAGSTQFGKLSLIFPQSKIINPVGPNVTGPGTLDNKTTIMAFGDPAGTLPPMQLLVENLDASF